MADGPVHEWIREWQNIKPVDVKSYAASLMADQDTIGALLRVFEDSSLQHLLDRVCGQLLNFYRSREPNLVHFSVQCLPPLMYAYLNACACRSQQTRKPVETLLLGIYNLEVIDERGQPRVVAFRMPTLIKQSVYHEPLHMSPSSLTEHSLSRLELGDAFSVEWGPLPQAPTVRASNRQQILTALMTVYNRHLSQLSRAALHACCRAIVRVCGQGFPLTSPLPPRLAVSAELQLEFLHAIYFIMYEELAPAATQALESVSYRGMYEVNARVTVAANAIRNSLNISPAGLADSQLNLSEMASVTSLPSVIKSIITNASFRTKKLPDDIDPLDPDVAELLPAPSPATPSPAAAAAVASHRLRAGIRKMRRRIRFKLARAETDPPDPDPNPEPDPEPEPEPSDSPSGSGSEAAPAEPARGSVSADDSFQWILTSEEHHHLHQTRLGRWQRLASHLVLSRRSRSGAAAVALSDLSDAPTDVARADGAAADDGGRLALASSPDLSLYSACDTIASSVPGGDGAEAT